MTKDFIKRTLIDEFYIDILYEVYETIKDEKWTKIAIEMILKERPPRAEDRLGLVLGTFPSSKKLGEWLKKRLKGSPYNYQAFLDRYAIGNPRSWYFWEIGYQELRDQGLQITKDGFYMYITKETLDHWKFLVKYSQKVSFNVTSLRAVRERNKNNLFHRTYTMWVPMSKIIHFDVPLEVESFVTLSKDLSMNGVEEVEKEWRNIHYGKDR